MMSEVGTPAGDTEPLAARLTVAVRPPAAMRQRKLLAELFAVADEAGVGAALRELLSRPDAAKLIAGTLDLSPFLRGLMLRDPARLARVLSAAPETHIAALLERARNSWRRADQAVVMATLRQTRAEAALTIALADLGGVFDVDQVCACLTSFADASLQAAVAFILAAEHTAGALHLPTPDDPERGSGWIVLAMGKHGAGELNFSSDIDLIVLFDREVAPVAPGVEAGPLFVRMTKRLVKILQDRTEDGYVFRTDLRLRPDPGSTAVAISTDAALTYYEGLGQNWERAALIKARPAAGDIAAGEAFLAELTPYIWRKYLDYAAISDIHSIKRQIHDHRGHAAIAVAGHNIKLGSGGIREIEFFVQTQQLIAGGRNPALRGRRTLDMLDRLAAEGWIAPEAARDLSAAYRTLRSIEHRLQMIADEQTHTLPEDEAELEVVARLCGLPGVPALTRRVLKTLETVRGYYARLFEAAPALSASAGSLVFTGDDEDPETVKTLAAMGYANPIEVSRTVRGWHFGRYPAMRSASARERLTEVTPALLAAFARTDNSDAAFLAFDRFLARLPAGLQLFSILGSNPALLDLLATILGTAPRLANIINQRPHVLDALMDPAFLGGRIPDAGVLGPRLDLTLREAISYEDALNRARIFGQEHAFLIGARVLAGTLDARRAGRAYADLADLLVARLLDLAGAEFARSHGEVPGGAVVVLAMGKLGGRELTAGSDIDLILLYEHADGADSSDGERALSPAAYYARLTQRLVAALSALTAEGRLYEVDFRLRPSGNSGPLASRFSAFATYQAKDAWTWEHMALTRARAIAGSPDLMARAGAEIATILRRPRPERKLAADVTEMRGLIEAEKGGEGIWDLKQAPGGLVDIEFVAQYLQLLHGHRHPEILQVETEACLVAAEAAGLLRAADAAVLLPALRLAQALNQVLRLCVDGIFHPAEAPKGLLAMLARAAELPDFPRLEAHLAETQAAARAAFSRVVGPLP